MPRIDMIQLLVIAADVLTAQSADLHIHDRLRRFEPILRPDGVAFRGEPAEELRPEVLQVAQLLRRQRTGVVFRQTLGGTDRHIREIAANLAAYRRPDRARDLARFLDLASLRLAVLLVRFRVGVVFRLRVVVAALTVVARESLRVERPEGYVN